MSSIKLLSKQLASQIAAGEVVERPASVVKELLENAVDAGGTSILCEIRNAGKVLVRVRDNGKGIVKDELPLALAPHATSKISTSDDLNSITTLGFRGEALASIASVSKLTLTSKTADEENAFAVSVEGPEQNPVIIPAAHPTGTTVDVCELFFNTPARRRFLKSDRTEFLRIKDIFVRVALAHPTLAFELKNDGKTVLRVSAASEEIDLKRISTLISSDFSKPGIPVVCEDPNLTIKGMVLPPPTLEESASEQIYLFLNGRPIADKLVTHALKEGFYEVLGKTLPIRCVIYLSIMPTEVDVNVHPRKDEVRFHEPSLIHDLITDAIVLALHKHGIGPYKTNADLLDNVALPETDAQSEDSTHLARFDVASNNLPQFPTGVSSFNQASAAPQEFNQATSSDQGFANSKQSASLFNQGSFSNSNAQANNGSYSSRGNSSFVGSSSNTADTNFCSNSNQGNFTGSYQNSFRNTESLNRNINTYRANVDSANSVVNATTSNVRDFEQESFLHQKITIIDNIDNETSFVKYEGKYYLVNLKAIKTKALAQEYIDEISHDTVARINLTMPFSVNVKESLVKDLKLCNDSLNRLGFKIKLFKNRIEFVEIPSKLKGCDLASMVSSAFAQIVENNETLAKGECNLTLAQRICRHIKSAFEGNLDAASLIATLNTDDPFSEFDDSVAEIKLYSFAQRLKERLNNE